VLLALTLAGDVGGSYVSGSSNGNGNGEVGAAVEAGIRADGGQERDSSQRNENETVVGETRARRWSVRQEQSNSGEARTEMVGEREARKQETRNRAMAWQAHWSSVGRLEKACKIKEKVGL
jgi:hypothetical protein